MKIGITSDIINTHTANHWQTAAEGIHKRVADVVAKNGSLPFILPIVNSKLINEYLQTVDGIIITGGCDIDPLFYHEKPLADVHTGERKRDLFEIKLVHSAIRAHKPVLGLCRGLQVINVALGGSLYQNIMTQIKGRHLIQHEQKIAGNQPSHYIYTKRGTYLAKTLGPKSFVNSRHHEAVKKLGKGLVVSAVAPDHVIEAAESPDGMLQGVQWHPEDLYYNYPKQEQLFKDYLKRVAKAKDHRSELAHKQLSSRKVSSNDLYVNKE